jgi:hypothetical protein
MSGHQLLCIAWVLVRERLGENAYEWLETGQAQQPEPTLSSMVG